MVNNVDIPVYRTKSLAHDLNDSNLSFRFCTVGLRTAAVCEKASCSAMPAAKSLEDIGNQTRSQLAKNRSSYSHYPVHIHIVRS